MKRLSTESIILISHYFSSLQKAFAPNSAFVAHPSTSLSATIAEGVEFDTVAREWRCKWSDEGDKASLVAAQKALESVLPEVKKVDGVKGVERIVCGGCLDFKVITSLTADKFGEWEEKGFPPEKDFLDMLKDVDGISFIETQTFTVSFCTMSTKCTKVELTNLISSLAFRKCLRKLISVLTKRSGRWLLLTDKLFTLS